jgi:hypothetical protein
MILRTWRGCRERHVQKLTPEQAEDIIRHCTSPKDDAAFAEKYGINGGYVYQIRTGRAWQWLRKEIEGDRVRSKR